MSMICLGILPVDSNNSFEILKVTIAQICKTHRLFCHFNQAYDISEPCLKRYRNSFTNCFVFSIADHQRFNNIEDFFTFSFQDGISQRKIKQNAAILSDIMKRITDSCRLKVCNLFVAPSGTLYEEFELLQVNQKTCSEMIEKSLFQSELACEHPCIHIVYGP